MLELIAQIMSVVLAGARACIFAVVEALTARAGLHLVWRGRAGGAGLGSFFGAAIWLQVVWFLHRQP